MSAIDTAARRGAAVLAAGLLLPLAACSSSDGSHGSGGGGGSGAASDVPGAARDEVRSGGTLRWAVDEAPATLNAFSADAAEATDRIAGATLPALFTLDKNAKPQLNEDYLESAEITERDPRQTVVYKLNPKAKWSDGRRISARDFRAQWQALSGGNGSYKAARNAGYDRIASIGKGEGKHEVKVVFARPYADWRSLFTPLYPSGATRSPRAFNEGSRTSLPATAGPFRPVGFSPGGRRVRLERDSSWWGDEPKLSRIELRAVPRGERQKALKKGQLDVAELSTTSADRVAKAQAAGKNGDRAAGEGAGPDGRVDPAGAPDAMHGHGVVRGAHPEFAGGGQREARADGSQRGHGEKAEQELGKLKGYTVRKALGPAYTQLALNGESGPLSDERVRRAVARAIDRGELAEHALGKAGLPAKPLGSHLRMLDQDGYSDSSDALGGKDVESAQGLLAEAGWEGVGSPGGGDGSEKKAEGGPAEADSASGQETLRTEPPERRTEAQQSVHLTRAEAAQVVRRPLSPAPEAATQRAGLLEQAAASALRGVHAEADDAKPGRGEPGAGNPEAKQLRAAKAQRAEARTARAHARELRLASNGSSSAVRMKEGKPLALRFVLPKGPGTAEIRATGERIASALDDVGVRTQVVKVPGEKYFKEYVAEGEYDLALYSWPASAYPATDARPIFAKPQPAADGSLQVEQNYTRIGTDQIDQLFEQAAGELDDDERRELIEKADARIWAAAGSVPLYQRPQLVAVKEGVANAGAFGFQTPRYQDIGFRG